MATEIRFGDNLASQNIVVVYKDEKGDYYLGHSFYYGGRNSEYLMFLYKDKLPMIPQCCGSFRPSMISWISA